VNKERFGKFLREQRVKVGLSRKELAEAIGMSDRTIKAFELGDISPAKERLFEWAKVLEVSPRTLFEELEEPFPLEEAPPKFVALPDDFPNDLTRQVELYAKFLQYQEEFEQFLVLGGYFDSDEKLQEDLDKFAREMQDLFSIRKNSREQKPLVS
jgi:transcriptional regulator with XRE-family HTH domain